MELIFDIIMTALFGGLILIGIMGIITAVAAIAEVLHKEIPHWAKCVLVWTSMLLCGWILCYGIGDLIIRIVVR